MIVLFVVGLIAFSDAPVHPCDGPTGYCGKQGQARTHIHYVSYNVWEALMLVTWPMGFGLLVLWRRKP